MRTFFLMLLLFVWDGPQNVYGQKSEYINIEPKGVRITKSIFSEVEIADTRFDTVYMGFVQKGAFNRKTSIELMQSMTAKISKSNENAQAQQKAFLGTGAGLDYGGLGIRAEFQPIKTIGIIGGFGYNLASPAYNVGLSFKVLPEKRITPTLMAMYGYNAVIRIKYPLGNVDAKTYYGPSIGAGCEIYDNNNKNKLALEIFLPFRSSEFHDRYDELKDAGYDFQPGILPITFTIGYNFSINKYKKKSTNQ